ncbi:hypothetical protein SPAR48_1057 [Streptococcus pneumoniae SPAR48]|nr:hypothetical protein SPAR48_1057 [Streptococcus pneumoniae SPAR48]
MRDKEQPKYSVLERKMFDAAKNQDMLAYQKYATIKQITDIRVQTSEADILEAVKEVYVYNHMNVIGACQRILFISQSPAYDKLNKWFNIYSDLYFSVVPLPKMGVYHEMVGI